MFFHVILTTECNLQCRYCFGESLDDFDEDFGDEIDVDYVLPRWINYDVDLLARFCRKDPECILTFYGGEPLLCADKIKQIIRAIEPRHFMIQTNGLLLDKLETKFLNCFHTVLVSIDGEEALTDYYRGTGTFCKVINNLRLIRQNGFTGELIARMTVMEQTDIYRQVRWLLANDEFSFSSVHWQLNAGFWRNDYKRRNFKQWSEENYIPGVRNLAKFWVDQMEKRGIVWKLYPLLGIAYSLLHQEENCLMRCGGGWINYAIQTDGYIVPCPTMWGMKKYYMGHIAETNPLTLGKTLVNNAPCTECDVLPICGGRCLYANITKRWSDQTYAEVCNTVKRLINSVDDQLPRIKNLVNKGTISLADFDYFKYNGCEIIP